jgi:hypothetical protein
VSVERHRCHRELGRQPAKTDGIQTLSVRDMERSRGQRVSPQLAAGYHSHTSIRRRQRRLRVLAYAVYIGGEVPDDGLGGGCTAAYAGQTRPGSAILGALLAVVVNLAHGDLPADPEAALGRVAADASWGVLHLGIMASVLLILFGLVGLSQMAERPLAQTLARLSLVAALPAAGVMLAGIAVDGFATKTLADLWANAVGPARPLPFSWPSPPRLSRMLCSTRGRRCSSVCHSC